MHMPLLPRHALRSCLYYAPSSYVAASAMHRPPAQNDSRRCVIQKPRSPAFFACARIARRRRADSPASPPPSTILRSAPRRSSAAWRFRSTPTQAHGQRTTPSSRTARRSPPALRLAARRARLPAELGAARICLGMMMTRMMTVMRMAAGRRARRRRTPTDRL